MSYDALSMYGELLFPRLEAPTYTPSLLFWANNFFEFMLIVLYNRLGNLVKYRHFICETKFGKGPAESDYQIPIKLPKKL